MPARRDRQVRTEEPPGTPLACSRVLREQAFREPRRACRWARSSARLCAQFQPPRSRRRRAGTKQCRRPEHRSACALRQGRRRQRSAQTVQRAGALPRCPGVAAADARAVRQALGVARTRPRARSGADRERPEFEPARVRAPCPSRLRRSARDLRRQEPEGGLRSISGRGSRISTGRTKRRTLWSTSHFSVPVALPGGCPL